MVKLTLAVAMLLFGASAMKLKNMNAEVLTPVDTVMA